ncbi:MAG: MarR family transcriptional regulator [Gammaproteobacteria bacterium]|nr:MarR family transcriptional regulator [Gammaproteobacteria bacterium]
MIDINSDIVDQLLAQWAEEHPQKDVSALGVVVRIQLLGKLLQRQATTALAKHALKHWEYDVLAVLRRQGHPFEMAATEIAKAAMLTTGAMTTRIDGLQSRGLVQRRKSVSDGRSIPVRLTAKGKNLIDHAIDTRLEDATNILGGIASADRTHLAKWLKVLLLEIDG